MYCPRCGAPNTDTTRFCRQCGLSLMEVTNYVATGGTAPLAPHASQAAHIAGSFSPNQKMWLSIVLLTCSPAIAAVLGRPFGLNHLLPGIFAVLMPITIPMAVMYFRNQAKRLAPMNPQPQAQMYAPPQPQPQAYLQAPLQAPMMPVSAVPSSETPRTTPNTNPFARQPISVIEDETNRLPS